MSAPPASVSTGRASSSLPACTNEFTLVVMVRTFTTCSKNQSISHLPLILRQIILVSYFRSTLKCRQMIVTTQADNSHDCTAAPFSTEQRRQPRCSVNHSTSGLRSKQVTQTGTRAFLSILQVCHIKASALWSPVYRLLHRDAGWPHVDKK